MLISDLKDILKLANEDFIELMNKLGLKDQLMIDDDLANTLIHRYSKKLEYENNSSLKRIYIQGLFNKYDYDIQFTESVNIFVGENGHGKTTIIKILVAALEGDYILLNSLPFKNLKIFFSDGNFLEVENTRKNSWRNFEDSYDDNDKIIHFIDPDKILSMESTPKEVKEILELYPSNSLVPFKEILGFLRELRSDRIISSAEYRRTSNFLNEYIIEVKEIKPQILEKVKYLPTFRRVEADLSEIYRKDLKVANHLVNGSLKFGLRDVQERLENLTSTLTTEAFETHSKINGEILADLLDNKPLKISNKQRSEITEEKVKIIISRIGKDNIKAADQLKSFIENGNGIYEKGNKDFLEYYIYKLISIYESQQFIDKKIKTFRNVCNKYLINKKLVYDEAAAKVKIIDKEDESLISFSELSSGEKQILSIFSELYLEETKKMIYIIDEPELSLSITWQKTILEDIYNSGKVALLIATTHSPFIFKNSLNSFAKDLNKFKTRTLKGGQ